jgi:hypothetical protein
MLRHPFDAISNRYSLGTLFRIATFVCVAAWFATFPVGRVLLGTFITITFVLIALACVTWVLGSLGQQAAHEESLDVEAPPSSDVTSNDADISKAC